MIPTPSTECGLGPTIRRWSLPALDAAKCVALQGEAPFETTHLALYRAFFTDGVNIGRPEEVIAGGWQPARASTASAFSRTTRRRRGRQAVLEDDEAAVSQHGIRAIPTVIGPEGRRVIGAVPLSEYQRVLGV